MREIYKSIKRHVYEIIERHRLWLNSSGKNGQQASLSGSSLRGVDLKGTDISGAILFIADLREANLDGTNLSGANLKFANLTGASLRNSNLSVADLNSANLKRADLSEATLCGANLGYANLISSNLISADFENANFEKTDLRKSILIGSKLVHIKNSRSAIWNDSVLSFAAIDRDTYKNIPSDLIHLYGSSLTEHNRKVKIKRSFILSRDYYRSGFLLLGYLSTVIRQTHPDLEMKFTIEQDEPKLHLFISTREGDRKTVEQILKKYSLVLKGELRSNILLPGSVYSAQLENQFEIARMGVKLADQNLQNYKNHNRSDSKSTDEKFEYLLRILADDLSPPDAPVKAATYFDGEKNMPNISEDVENLQNDVRKLRRQCPSIEYEFSVLSELVSYPEPCKTDIRKAKITLAMVNRKEPRKFFEIIKTVRDCSNQIPESKWPAIISETVNRHF